ncbi:unnamed protein product [Bursaphelenchus xylophilus]|uniref:Conserved oligomeric Golgi complex subunit 2 n=1 Tax=Bursaphelenchus xylophilus TaxID=6326 RepID=A0A1I7S3A0_BURXY|nr:unnamed protein product [Bursaphelenchus xylophilus]CAG9116163.1 unnamed protein product [Bursaphelenchus xylophilus]
MTVNTERKKSLIDGHVENGIDLKFCFDPGLLDRSDFTVEKFINFNRKRATLDQIHNDLRAFLRHLQNSMVELINDDYADFVNLSANLAALKESIDKVSTDVVSAWDGFESSNESIKETANLINRKSEEIIQIRQHQVSVRNKILFLTSLDRLSLCLTKRPSDLSQKWYLKLINILISIQVWQLRIPENDLKSGALVAKDVCFGKAKKLLTEDLVTDLRSGCQFVIFILAGLKLIRELEYASKIISYTVIKSSVDVVGSDPIDQLVNAFEQCKKLRTQWITNLQIHDQYTQEASHFLDDALMEFILGFLDDNLSSLCLPSDPSVFFRSHMITYNFASSFPQINAHPAFLNGLRDRYNTMLYVKRLTAPFRDQMASAISDLTVKYNQSEDRLHPFDPSNTVLRAIDTLYSDNYFLPNVSPEIWEFTLKLLEQHHDWINKCSEVEPCKAVDEISGVISVKERWPDLVILVAGAHSFYTKLYDFCVTKIFKKFHEMNAEEGPFRQFVIEYNGLAAENRAQIIDKIIKDLVEKSAIELMKVAEIPKHYRWTKKPAPTASNPYVDQAFEYQKKFKEQAEKMEWIAEWITETLKRIRSEMVDIFLEHAGKVLSSVQQTGSSLQRFKRKGLINSESSDKVAETDEFKIKLQLQLDTARVREAANEVGISVDKLDQFLEAIQQTEA